MICFSGTHLNPCVTLGIFIAGEVRAYLAIIYVLMQIIGGEKSIVVDARVRQSIDVRLAIGAAGLLRLLMPKDDYSKCHGGVTVLNDNIAIDCWQVESMRTIDSIGTVCR